MEIWNLNLNWNWINLLRINYLFENSDCVPVFLTFKMGYKFSWFYRFAEMYRKCIKIAWFSLAEDQLSPQQMNNLFTTIFSKTKKYELVFNAFQPDWSANTRFTCFSQIVLNEPNFIENNISSFWLKTGQNGNCYLLFGEW